MKVRTVLAILIIVATAIAYFGYFYYPDKQDGNTKTVLVLISLLCGGFIILNIIIMAKKNRAEFWGNTFRHR